MYSLGLYASIYTQFISKSQWNDKSKLRIVTTSSVREKGATIRKRHNGNFKILISCLFFFTLGAKYKNIDFSIFILNLHACFRYSFQCIEIYSNSGKSNREDKVVLGF